ncbi:hypothetical protein CEXT_582041 [Caerostris extrusa]|uniref:CRESS-DNA virus Rep endonuclease domain-containing protein n=1 Tax=Caerostris extrusa TaxID=172846 RepID=A0AAV4UN31_CAEEX|nr:hypothetical protein CEXT_582041 [Caerostris extrusa]
MAENLVRKTGKPHLQGYMVFKNSQRLSAAKKILPAAHLEISRGYASGCCGLFLRKLQRFTGSLVKIKTHLQIFFIAAFSTAWARLKLYQEMDKLDENALYHDKDGIICASDGKNDLPPDNSLEEFYQRTRGRRNYYYYR